MQSPGASLGVSKPDFSYGARENNPHFSQVVKGSNTSF